jgi:5-bromo-4-chloroindolyl phosphate hydrolysis protein
MAAQEISFVIDWSVWVPITIAVIALASNLYQIIKNSGRNRIAKTERTIERARKTLDECETNLTRCGHEKDELRRENVELLKQVAAMAKSPE